jgi:apolipoprotein N-acyltransferase
MISSVYLLSVVLQVGQFEGAQRDIADVLRVGTGVFALILFSLSLYAWSRRRRQPALAIVSSAFLLFFLKQAIWLLSDAYDFGSIELLLEVFDFVILALFFLAIVLRPRRKQQEQI